MKRQKSVIDEAEKHLQASAGKNRCRVIDAVQKMPTFGGPVLPYCVSATEGAEYPVSVGEMYICCGGWEEFHNKTVAGVAQAIPEAEQIKEA